ncbi:MAG: SHOCT domain-containing protein [Candidatus Dormiibacterota bacterium]
MIPVRPGRGTPIPNPGPFQGQGRLAAFPWWIHVVEVLIVVGLVVLLVVVLMVAFRGPRRLVPPPGAITAAVSPALSELDLRYARGEIDHDDYLQRRANLLGQAQPRPPAVAEPPPTPEGRT